MSKNGQEGRRAANERRPQGLNRGERCRRTHSADTGLRAKEPRRPPLPRRLRGHHRHGLPRPEDSTDTFCPLPFYRKGHAWHFLCERLPRKPKKDLTSTRPGLSPAAQHTHADGVISAHHTGQEENQHHSQRLGTDPPGTSVLCCMRELRTHVGI